MYFRDIFYRIKEMKKLQVFSALGFITAILNPDVAYSAAAEGYHADEGAATATASYAAVARATLDLEDANITSPVAAPLGLFQSLF